MQIDPLIEPGDDYRTPRSEPLAQLLAVGIVLLCMTLTIGGAEFFARAVLDTPVSADQSVSFEARAEGRTYSVETSIPVASAPEPSNVRYAPQRCDWVLPLMERHGLPTWMVAVADRESRCTASAFNGNSNTGDRSYGLFQINTLGSLWGEVSTRCNLADQRDLLDADTNVACAAALYRAYGYRPWDSGRYFR